MSRGRSARRARRGNTLFAIVGLAVVAIMLLGTFVTLLPPSGPGNDGLERQDASVQVTPGAEVARLETQVSRNPDDIDAMVVLAEVLANSGRSTEAVPWFERAIASRPDDAQLRLAFARTLMRMGSWYDAELQLLAAYDSASDDASVAYYLGELYETRTQPDLVSAVNWYGKAVELDPGSVVANQAQDRLTTLGPATGSPVASPSS